MAEGYIEQPEAMKALEQYLEGSDRSIMVLYAPSGRGKTTLLCALARRLRKKGGLRVLLRSCGSGQDTSSVLGVFDSILRQLSVTPPLEIGELKTRIGSYLEILAREKTVLFLDALDQIPDGGDVLRFLPGVLPENLKIICSIRQNSMTGDLTPSGLNSRGIKVLEVPPFASKEDKQALVDGYLETHLKKLGDTEQELLFEKKGSSNPLYLKAALSELRITGRNSMLADLIDSFGDEPEDVFDVILARMEEDMGSEEEGGHEMVSWLFSLLACSRYGLEQDMLCEAIWRLMPDADRETIRSIVRACQRQVRDFLMQFGLLTDLRYFAFRNAARRRYPQLLKRAHSEVGARFLANLGEAYQEGSGRDYTEAVYHLLAAEEDRAAELLSDIRFMRGMLACCGVSQLIECYDAAAGAAYLGEERLAGLRNIGMALKNGGYILQLRPWELEGQLSLRLDSEADRQFLQDMAEKTGHAWLRVVHRAEAGGRFHVIAKSAERVICIARHREGLVVAEREGGVRLLALPGGSVIRTIRKSGEPISCACVIGNHIYLGDDEGTLYSYDLDTGAQAGKSAVMGSAVTALAAGRAAGSSSGVEASGAVLYAADLKGSVAKIDLSSLSVLTSCRFPCGVSALYCDGKNVYAGGRNGEIWKCAAGTLKKLHTFKTYMGIVTALYSDGKYLYAGGFSETVACFDLATGKYADNTLQDNDSHITQIFPVGGFIGAFSGRTAGLRNWQTRETKSPSGLAQAICLLCGEDDREADKQAAGEDDRGAGGQEAGGVLYFATKEGQIGYAPVEAFLMEDADSTSPVQKIVNGNRTVLIVGENHRIRLYDKETGGLILSDQMKSERVADACFYEKYYILGRVKGQIVELDESGNISDLVKYNDSISINSDIPVRPIACADNQIVYYRYGDLNHTQLRRPLLQRTDGKITRLGKPSDCDCILVDDFKVYYACGKKVTIYDLVDNKEVAQFEIPYRAGKMIRKNYVLLIACEEGAILTYSLRRKEFIGDVFRGSLTDFDLAEDLMCVSSGEGPVFLYRGAERLASLTLDDKPYAVCMDEEAVCAGTYGGGYLQLKLENEKAAPAARGAAVAGGGAGTQKAAPVARGEAAAGLRAGEVIPEEAFPGGRGSYHGGMNSGESRKAADELPGIRPLKNQTIPLVLHGLLFIVSIGCVMRGDMISGVDIIKSMLREFSTWLYALILLGMFFFLRLAVAEDEKGYRNNARILPGSIMLAASSVIFMLICGKCMAAGNPGGIKVARVLYMACISAQYPYLLAAYLLSVWIKKLIGIVDKYLELYVNVTTAVTLLVMIVAMVVL